MRPALGQHGLEGAQPRLGDVDMGAHVLDAMGGEGTVLFHISERRGKVLLDISDTGKGVPKSQFKTLFYPGFTTKERGWGLGLSLVKRIVEEYHKGKIFVKESELGKGTTFRMVLK